MEPTENLEGKLQDVHIGDFVRFSGRFGDVVGFVADKGPNDRNVTVSYESPNKERIPARQHGKESLRGYKVTDRKRRDLTIDMEYFSSYSRMSHREGDLEKHPRPSKNRNGLVNKLEVGVGDLIGLVELVEKLKTFL